MAGKKCWSLSTILPEGLTHIHSQIKPEKKAWAFRHGRYKYVKYQCFPSKQEVAINPFCMVYSAPNFIYWVTEHIFVSVFCHSHSSPLWQEEITLLMILYCEHQSFPIYIFFPKRRVVEPQVKEWGEGRSGEGQSEPFLAVCVLLTD